MKNEGIAEFIDFARTQSPGAVDECISFETIKVESPLAVAWTPYNFYYKGQLGHCGVNSFQLFV